MSSVKFVATIAAVLFMSAGAAQAGGRPFADSGTVNLPASTLAMSIEYRRQANYHIAIAGISLASRYRPVSKPFPPRLVAMVPDCLRADRVASSFTLRAEKALATGDIRFVDRIVTSSMSRSNSEDF